MKLLIIILLLSIIGIGDAAYMNNTKIGLDNGAYITVMDTHFSSLKKSGKKQEFAIEEALDMYCDAVERSIS